MLRFICLLLVSVVVVPACKKDSPTQAISDEAVAGATNDLWDLAPKDSFFGLVISKEGATHLINTGTETLRILTAVPKTKELLDKLRSTIKDELKGIDALDPKEWTKVGIDPSKGFAIFVRGTAQDADGGLMFLPVVDRAKFLAVVPHEKKTIAGKEYDELDSDLLCTMEGSRYLCGDKPETIAAAGDGKGELQARVGKLSKNLRGHIELVGIIDKPGKNDFPLLESFTTGALAIRFADGRMVARGWLGGKANSEILKGLAPSPAQKQLVNLGGGSSSLMRLALPWQYILKEGGAPESIPTPVGFDARKDLLDQLTGEFALYSAGDSLIGFVLGIGMHDTTKLKQVLGTGCGLANGIPGVTAQTKDSTCEGLFNPAELQSELGEAAAGLAMIGKTKFKIEVKDQLVVAALGGEAKQGSAADAVLAAEGKDLAAGNWQYAFWSRWLDPVAANPALGKLMDSGMEMVAAREPQGPGYLHGGRALLAHLYGFGAGVALREDGIHFLAEVTTVLADSKGNQADYTKAVATLVADGDGKAYTAATTAAASGPDSALGRIAASANGNSGPMATALIGASAAVAIPAFMKYIKKSKAAEARQLLRMAHDGARAYATSNPLASGQAALLASTPITPPLGACCQSGEKCMPNAALWQHPTWEALQFSVDDPHYYSYQYVADGERFAVKAFGDLDCDGQYSTYTLVGPTDSWPEIIEEQALE